MNDSCIAAGICFRTMTMTWCLCPLLVTDASSSLTSLIVRLAAALAARVDGLEQLASSVVQGCTFG